jgi:hypothetical protein
VIPRPSRRGWVVLVPGLVLAVGAGGWLVACARGATSVEATVQGFFEARQAGDCERLVDYLDASSWSEEGNLSREEFLAFCEEAIEDYQPELAEVEVVSQTEDSAVVQMSIPLDDEALSPVAELGDRQSGFVVGAPALTDEERADVGADAAYEQGQLVREGSTWRVRLDPWFLRIGRSVEQTVAGYLHAYRDGDCEDATRFVSDDAWSGDSGESGDRDAGRQQFVERCQAVAERSAEHRQDGADDPSRATVVIHPLVVAQPTAVELTTTRRDRATAQVHWNGRATQTILLVRQDVTWKLTDPTLDVVRSAELGTRLLSESDVGLPPGTPAPVHPQLRTDPFALGPQGFEGGDAAEQRDHSGFQTGLTNSYGETPHRVDLLAYEFADAEGARRYADHLGGRIAQNATRYQQLTPVEVPGIDSSLAVVTECAGPAFRHASQPVDCRHANKAAAVGARGQFVVSVELTDYEGPDLAAGELLDQATNLLRTQLDRL